MNYLQAAAGARELLDESLLLDSATSANSATLVDVEQLLQVKLGLAQDLALADEDILERVDAVASDHDVLADGLRDELTDELVQVGLGTLAGHDLDHLLADGAHVTALGVGGLGHLLVAALREADAEEAEDVAVGGLDVAPGLDEGVPLLDEGAQLVAGEVHAVEVGEEGESLDFLAHELHLAEGDGFVLVEVSEVSLEDAADEGVRGGLCRKKRRHETNKNGKVRSAKFWQSRSIKFKSYYGEQTWWLARCVNGAKGGCMHAGWMRNGGRHHHQHKQRSAYNNHVAPQFLFSGNNSHRKQQDALGAAATTQHCRRIQASQHVLRPEVRFTRVLPILRTAKVAGTWTSYQSLRVIGSMIFLRPPLRPFLFFPIAMMKSGGELRG